MHALDSSPKKRPNFLRPLTKVHSSDSVIWPSKESVTKKDIDKRSHVSCKYVLCRKNLGSGSYSVVIEGRHVETNLHYAIKKISKKLMYGREQLIQNEFKILRKISQGHKNILNLIDYFETDDDLFIVTDLALGGELFDKILNLGNFYEEDAVDIVTGIVNGISYLHDNNIVHRDLKAENLLFKTTEKKSELLIADFGLAKIFDLDKLNSLTTKCGTLSYMAPELFDKKGHGFSVDIWSLGVLTYFILCGYMPFDCETDEETKEAILKADYMYEPPEYWEHISSNAKDFIDRCFKIDTNERMTAKEALNHPFIGENGNISVDNKQLIEPSKKSFNLLPNVKSNLSLHKLGFSPRHSPMTSPMQLSPNQSFVDANNQSVKLNENKSDYFQFHSSASQASLSRLKEAALAMYQHQQLPHIQLQAQQLISPSISSANSTQFSSNVNLKTSTTSLTRDSSYSDIRRKLGSRSELLMNGSLCYAPEYVYEFTSLMTSRVGSGSNSKRASRNQSRTQSRSHSKSNSTTNSGNVSFFI